MKYKYALLFILVATVVFTLFFVIGHDDRSMEEKITERIKALPTYQAGGHNLVLTETDGIGYTFQFEKPFVGYGEHADRIKQDVVHVVQVETLSGKVVSIRMDGRWDALEQRLAGVEEIFSHSEEYGLICAEKNVAMFGFSDDALTVTAVLDGELCGGIDYTIRKDLESFPPKTSIILEPLKGECEDLGCSVFVVYTFEIDSFGFVGDLEILYKDEVLLEQPYTDWSCVVPKDCPLGYACTFVEENNVAVHSCIPESWDADQSYYDSVSRQRDLEQTILENAGG